MSKSWWPTSNSAALTGWQSNLNNRARGDAQGATISFFRATNIVSLGTLQSKPSAYAPSSSLLTVKRPSLDLQFIRQANSNRFQLHEPKIPDVRAFHSDNGFIVRVSDKVANIQDLKIHASGAVTVTVNGQWVPLSQQVNGSPWSVGDGLTPLTIASSVPTEPAILDMLFVYQPNIFNPTSGVSSDVQSVPAFRFAF